MQRCAAPRPPHSEAADPRLREVVYDPRAVVTVPVKRGVVTLVVLDADESITEVAAGLGGDCTKADAAWCVAAQPGGRNLFVKAKSSASAANNLAVVTDRRTHTLPLRGAGRWRSEAAGLPARGQGAARVGTSGAPRPARGVPLDRAAGRAAATPAAAGGRRAPASQAAGDEHAVLDRRGRGSQDIVPTLVFDDGRFTYLRFPGNREVPAVFHVLGDGSETLVNARMEDDLLVVDRVSRRLMLRAGSAVVGLWNEAFDLDGRPPGDGTTVPGVQRVLKADVSGNNAPSGARKGATP